MEFIEYLTQSNIAGFLLLLLRFSGLFAFFPFFENQLVSVNVRGALAFFCTILFFPLVPPIQYDLNLVQFMLSGMMEILFGFCVGLVLQLVFGALSFGGDLMSFAMGLSVASAYDPMSGASKPIVAQVIFLLALVVALVLDFHHGLFLLVSESLQTLPLGTFALQDGFVEYCVKGFLSLIIVGFAMAFPIVGILLLSDVIFGMIMKTNPQFNLLAIGFPIKIAIGLFVIMIVLPSIIFHFENELIQAFLFSKTMLNP